MWVDDLGAEGLRFDQDALYWKQVLPGDLVGLASYSTKPTPIKTLLDNPRLLRPILELRPQHLFSRGLPVM
jgi:hypothetical protein